MIEKVFIVHYKKLEERKNYLEPIINSWNIPYEFCCYFDRDNLNDDDLIIIDNSESNKNKRKQIYNSQNIKPPGVGCSAKKGWMANLLEHYNIIKRIAESDMSDVLILEDDVIIDENFISKCPDYINDSGEGERIIYLGDCCGIKIKNKSYKSTTINHNKTSLCSDSFILNNKTAKKLLNDSIPFYYNWDWELNYLQYKNNIEVYWVNEPLITQGSQKGNYISSF